jgi:hypothetical protein
VRKSSKKQKYLIFKLLGMSLSDRSLYVFRCRCSGCINRWDVLISRQVSELWRLPTRDRRPSCPRWRTLPAHSQIGEEGQEISVDLQDLHLQGAKKGARRRKAYLLWAKSGMQGRAPSGPWQRRSPRQLHPRKSRRVRFRENFPATRRRRKDKRRKGYRLPKATPPRREPLEPHGLGAPRGLRTCLERT